MGEPILIICNCGENLDPDISEEYNFKDIVYCERCGREFLYSSRSRPRKKYLLCQPRFFQQINHFYS